MLAFYDINASIACMATLTIRQLDEHTKARLRLRAAHHGRSMEEEAREILRCALVAPARSSRNLAQAIRERFKGIGGVELELPRRDRVRRTPDLSS
jgi:plasmid stability protein